MGNASSVQLDGEAAGGVSRHQPVDVSIHSSTKSWATMDHSISGPWGFLVKEEVQCLCEGGRNCAHENPARQKAANAIAGLHSSWVGDEVLAMARPWQENVLKHDVVSQFKQQNIGMILNLQEVGEHESCGPGNMAISGFTYNPETFMAAKIGVYNISWRDMGVPTLEKMMDIVQIMHYTTSVECRKVAVHCHAGLGRTGLAIACYLLASGQAPSAPKAVEMVRAARPGSLQTQAQVIFVSIFEQYLQHLRCMFKVADLKHLSLGNTNYIVTKVCRRISRSLSGMHQASSTGTPDAFAAAAAALGPLAFTPTGSGGSGFSSAPGSATAAAAAAQGQPDWASATYDVMSPTDTAQLAATPAEVAANAALNLGSASGGAAAGQEGLVMHARRMSGGGNMKMVSNLKAIEEEGDKPVHVIQTDTAVTEVYGHGLTIIRATDSVKKMYATPCGVNKIFEQPPADQQLPTAHDLGLDKQLPWNNKFAIRPEAFKAEGWLPEPPASYLEALRRQQRLLHGQERRRCLHQHKLLRSAAKALAAAAEAYKSAPVHTDATEIPRANSVAQGSPPFKRMHTRSRSNASALDVLAVTGSLSPSSSGIPQAELHRSPSANGSLQTAVSGPPAAADVPPFGSSSPGGSLLSKHHQQQQLAASSPGAAAAAASSAGAVPTPDSASALLPGLHLGPPGTNPVPSSTSGAISRTGSGARKLARQGSSAKARKSAHKAGAAATAAAGAPGDFFLSTDGSSAAAAVQGGACGASAAGVVASCTPLLSGCCAPSFAVGLLIALLYKGRFPEEFEAQWSTCPRLKALGLDEGHAVCQALQDVKLAVNTGSYGPLESASGAVAVCVLADWFETFKDEAFTEATLELLVDEAEGMLAEVLDAAVIARAQEDQQQQQQPEASRSSVGSSGLACGLPPTHLPPLNLSAVHSDSSAFSSAKQSEDESGVLARKAAARSVCSSLAPFEQDLCLMLAAVLRHARHTSLDDPRLQELGLNYSQSGSNPTGSGRLSAGGAPSSSTSGDTAHAAAVVEAQVDAAMAVLYRLVAGWLLGPLALQCVPALEAVAAFLHYLTVDDNAYGCLLHAIQQGVRRARTAPTGALWDSSDSVVVAPRSNPNSPRASQQQQNLDRLEKLKTRLLGAGASFKLKPLSTYYKQHKQAAAAGAGAGVKFAEPALQASSVGAAAAAQHGIGKSKLRHASSSPELANMQQQGQSLGGAAAPKHAKSKLGGAASAAGELHGTEADGSSPRGSKEEAGGPGLPVSPEPKHGCAASWTSLLTQKMHSKSSKKHQQQALAAADVQEQQQQHGSLAATADQQQQLSGDGAHASGPGKLQLQPHPPQQQQCSMSPVTSSCGDSISELIHAGNCQELCVGVGQQGQGQAVGHMEDDLAMLTGQPLMKVAEEDSRGALGALDSPPRSVSPDSSPTAARKQAGRGGSNNGSSGGPKHQHPLHIRLAPLQRNSLQAGSEGGSSFTNSPCSSMGSITGLIMAAQLHQGFQLQQAGPGYAQPSNAPAAAAAAVATGGQKAGGSGAAASATRGLETGVVPAVISSGELSCQSSHAVSVSAMSELQLQSSASRVSTGSSGRTTNRTVSR